MNNEADKLHSNEGSDKGNPAASHRLSEAEMLEYTSLDPFALTTDKPWEIEVKSVFLRRLAIVAVVVVMAVHLFMGLTLDVEFTGARVTGIDKLAFPLVGVVISVLVWLALTRPRLRANADGVEVRNIIGSRFYPWQLIYGLSFPEGDRMARLELPEFEFVPVWALQSADRERAMRDVRAFRQLEAKYMPED